VPVVGVRHADAWPDAQFRASAFGSRARRVPWSPHQPCLAASRAGL
jgi:hypothetical protein